MSKQRNGESQDRGDHDNAEASGHPGPGFSLQEQIGMYLASAGLSFDFDAGRAHYDYQVAIGTEGPDVLGATRARDYFWGLAGEDRISGGRQDDILYGDAGNDLLSGRDGADRAMGGGGDDQVFGGDGADMVAGGPGNDYLDEGAGHGDVEGGPGDDILVGGQGPDAFGVEPGSGNDIIRDFTAGPGMFDHLALRDLNWEDLGFQDTADGVKISWAGGSVLLEGVHQADLAQDDFMFAEAPDLPPSARDADQPAPERSSPSREGPEFRSHDLPGEGFDRIADKILKAGPIQFAFQGDEAYQVAVGTKGDDVYAGTPAWDHFFGRDGSDTASGGDGNDILQGDAGDDYLDGGNGMDRADGGMGNDWLIGGLQADEIMGREGNDIIDAGPGHDMIEGGPGNDDITGGTGADAFIVSPDSGFDIVRDFEATGEAQGAFDHLALRDIRPDQVSVVDTTGGALVTWNTIPNPEPEGGVLLEQVFRADLRQSDFMFVGEPGFVAGINDFGSHYVFPANGAAAASDYPLA